MYTCSRIEPRAEESSSDVRDLVVKIYNYSDQDSLKTCLDEYKILNSLNHKAIVKAARCFVKLNKCHIVMERAQGLTLSKFLAKKFNDNIDDRQPMVSTVMRNLVEAVAYLHSQHVSHRDIKPDNIIVDDDFSVKLIDYNVSVRYEPSLTSEYPKSIKGGTGVKQWSAPETRSELFYSAKCDSWSLGCIFYYLLSGAFPPDELSYEKSHNLMREWISENSPQNRELFDGLTEMVPESRLSPTDALKLIKTNPV